MLSVLALASLASNPELATTEPQWRLPVSVAVFNHSYALPLRDMGRLAPLHPGISGGSEFNLTRGRFGALAVGGELGWFRSAPIQTAWFLNADLVYRSTASFGPFVTLLLGPGYLHSFSTRQVFEQRGDGYVEATDWGSSHLTLSLGFGAGFDFGKVTELPCSLFIRYRFSPQIPGFIGAPALPNALLQLGARYEFGAAR